MRIQPFLIFLFISFLLGGCKLSYQTASFLPIKHEIDYAALKHLAVYAGISSEGNEIGAAFDAASADVFYVYPTLLTDKKDINWNAAIDDAKVNADVKMDIAL